MIAFTPELIWVILVAIVISTVSAVVIWRHTRTMESAREVAMRRQREAQRFRREPRVGDRAGYYARGEDQPDAFWVGEVTRVDRADRDRPRVGLSVPIVTPFGASVQSGWWDIDALRWFPPDTPLGLYAGTVDGDDEGEAHS